MTEGTAGLHSLGNVVLQNGITFRDMKLSYKAFGQMNAEKSNVIVFPTSYQAKHGDLEHMIGPGRALDPAKYFIVILELFGNGNSSSPSNAVPPFDKDRFPTITVYDNVMAQKRLMAEVFGVERIFAAVGWSMGAQQSYHWGALFPDQVERIAINCGSARTAPHNRVFLEAIKAILAADPHWRGGWFDGVPERGLRAVARLYAGWALSQTFYREETWRTMGYSSLEDFLIHNWEGPWVNRDAANALCHVWTWSNADISANSLYNGDLPKALSSIKARTLLMPGDHDLYFQVADNELEMRHLKNAELTPIPSIWGHRAGNPTHCKEDRDFVDAALKRLFAWRP